MLPILGQELPLGPATPTTLRDPENLVPADGTERTVIRVEGMDCASCAATVEKHVSQLPGVRRAVVNFAAGRLDAEHDPDLALEELEKAVRDAGYGVAYTQEVERTALWRTPRALSVFASALLFALGFGLGFASAPEVARVGAYMAAIVVGGLPIFRAALAGVRARHLDMNVLMSVATIGGAAIGEWAEAASVMVLFAAGNALQIYAIDRTRGPCALWRGSPRKRCWCGGMVPRGWSTRTRSPWARPSSSGPGSDWPWTAR